LEALTGMRFNLAAAGSQEGRDMSSRGPNTNVVAVECKRYGKNTELNERELLGELAQVQRDIPDLDLWVVVTSRTVSSQLEEALNYMAVENGIGFFIISSGDGSPSSLETLCACSPEVVVAHPGVDRIAAADDVKAILRRITEKTEYLDRISALKAKFSSPLAGYGNWRAEQNRCFLKSLTSDRESRASYGQPINVEEQGVLVIRRERVWASLDGWYHGCKDKHIISAALGEEGDGKTWSVASWLSNSIKSASEFPAVIFLSSTEISSIDIGATGLQSLFAELISQRLPRASKEQAQRRLDRWLSRPDGQSPLILLALDGINERRSPDWWRGVLEKLNGEPWFGRVAVLVTCRTSYWERYFSRLQRLPASPFTVQPYDDAELNTALARHSLRRESIQEQVLPLIRKPRYFDLMVKHHNRIADSGDVTVARVIYEDWRDRFERKRAITLTDEEFQNMIRQLAQAHQQANPQLSGQDVVSSLPPFADHHHILEELQTGGVLQFAKGKYQVSDRLLVYGFGLLLVDQVEQAIIEGQQPREAIAGWLEPHAEMDMKAAICEFAALQALGSDTIPLDAKVALLESWIGSHNQTQSTENNLTAYLPINPEAYVALAEAIYSDAHDNKWSQEQIIRSFLRWCESPQVSAALQAAFERWLGFVHIHGFPFGRRNIEDVDNVTREIAARMGKNVELGPLEFAGYPFTVIDDDGRLRLGKAALTVISHLPRNQFIRTLAIGCLAEAIMGDTEKYDLFSWVIRTSPRDIWPDLRNEVDRLLAVDSVVTQRAAYWLLSFEGGTDAHSLRESIPADIFPPNLLAEWRRKDPCHPWLVWSLEDCITCLQRDDLGTELVARKIGPYCVDPNFVVPEPIRIRLNALCDRLGAEDLWVAPGPTVADHDFKTYEPALAAYQPNALASLVRSIIYQVIGRSDIAQQELRINLEEHYLILTKREQETVRCAWDDIVSRVNHWSGADEDTEADLFKIILTQLGGNDQLAALLRRPQKALDKEIYEKSFLPITKWEPVRAALTNTANVKSISRILWFLSANPSCTPDELLCASVVPLLNHSDGYIRSLVLELIYHAKGANAINSVIQSRWAWDSSDSHFQNRWGSLILCEHGTSLSFDNLCKRVHPSYLGYAMRCRGNEQLEIETYAEVIHHLWADDSYTCRITFVSQNTTNGLPEENDELNSSGWDPNSILEHRQKLRDIILETVEQQKINGNIWLSQNLDSVVLDKLMDACPDLLDKWISRSGLDSEESPAYINHNRSFYTALCRILLKKQVGKGVELYWQLERAPHVRTVSYDAQIDLLDYALFGASPCDESIDAWQRKLELCNTDQELMKIAMLAQHGAAGDWLWSYINERLHASAPLDRARSTVLLGFFDSQEAFILLQELMQNGLGSCPGKLIEEAKLRWNNNKWAQYWFNRFLTVIDDVDAWASYRLLLRCVDSRFYFWHKRIVEMTDKIGTDSRRKTFLHYNLENIRIAVRNNEKDMAERFLGQIIMRQQVWPWMWRQRF